MVQPMLVRVGRRRGTAFVFVLLAVVVALAVGAMLLPNPFAPFGRKTTDRSGPAVLRSVQNLSRFVAASGTFQQIVDLEVEAKYIPSIIYGNRVLFVATGTVEVYVEFGTLSGDAVRVSADRATVVLTLPA